MSCYHIRLQDSTFNSTSVTLPSEDYTAAVLVVLTATSSVCILRNTSSRLGRYYDINRDIGTGYGWTAGVQFPAGQDIFLCPTASRLALRSF
jgi:hypothetical protein